jgi:hypothetical protein
MMNLILVDRMGIVILVLPEVMMGSPHPKLQVKFKTLYTSGT